MFNLSHFFASLFAATAQQVAEEEQREREEHVDRILEDYNSEKEEERLFFQRLDEESKQEKELWLHVIGITMNENSWNGKCKMRNYTAMTKRISKAEWTLSMVKSKVKVGIRTKIELI